MLRKVLYMIGIIGLPMYLGGVVVDYSTSSRATAYPSAPHLTRPVNENVDWVCYQWWDYLDSIYRTRLYQLDANTGQPVEYDTGLVVPSPDGHSVAFPTIASDSCNNAVVVAFLTDPIDSSPPNPNSYSRIYRGKLFFAVYFGQPNHEFWAGPFPLVMDSIIGTPSIRYGGIFNTEEEWQEVYYISVAKYPWATQNWWQDKLIIEVYDIWCMYPHGPGTTPYVVIPNPQPLVTMENRTIAGEEVNRPSTAVFNDWHWISDDAHYYEWRGAYLHTAWNFHDGNFNVGYNVAYWPNPSPYYPDRDPGNLPVVHRPPEELEPTSGNDNYNPYMFLYGDKIYLTWEKNLPGREIVRRYRDALPQNDSTIQQCTTYVFNRRYGWHPTISNDTTDYQLPCTLSTWSAHNSQNLLSRWPQGSATSVAWMEQAGPSSEDYNIWYHEYDPDLPPGWQEGGGGMISECSGSIPDSFPHIWTNVVLDTILPDSIWRVSTEWHFWWTSGDGPPYELHWFRMDTTYSTLCAFSPPAGSKNRFLIDPNVPVFYEIKGGSPKPSRYCLKRDGVGTFNGHSVDIGTKELLYTIPIPEPAYNFLIRAVVSSPQFITPGKPAETISETIDFDGKESFLVSATPTKPETLDYLLPWDIRKDHGVIIKIKGNKGAYLENLKVYRIDRIKGRGISQRQTSQGTQSLNPSISSLSLTITPTLSQFGIDIKYQIRDKGRVSLCIYDVSGRIVRTLLREEREPGIYTLSWDKRDDAGRILPAGIYFVRLRANGSALTKKVMLIR